MFKLSYQKWLEQHPKNTQEWLKKQPIWHDKDMFKAVCFGITIGLIIGFIL